MSGSDVVGLVDEEVRARLQEGPRASAEQAPSDAGVATITLQASRKKRPFLIPEAMLRSLPRGRRAFGDTIPSSCKYARAIQTFWQPVLGAHLTAPARGVERAGPRPQCQHGLCLAGTGRHDNSCRHHSPGCPVAQDSVKRTNLRNPKSWSTKTGFVKSDSPRVRLENLNQTRGTALGRIHPTGARRNQGSSPSPSRNAKPRPLTDVRGRCQTSRPDAVLILDDKSAVIAHVDQSEGRRGHLKMPHYVLLILQRPRPNIWARPRADSHDCAQEAHSGASASPARAAREAPPD